MLDKVIGHESIKKQLREFKNNIPPVMIFIGPAKVGKIYTAYHLIDEIYQGSFSNRLFNHPDIHLFESDTQTFKVELIEKFKEALITTPFELDKKFYLLRDIGTMSKDSYNKCLKILEDRTIHDYFILTSDYFVPNTIKSRGVVFNFTPVLNVRDYYPNLSDLQIKMIQGCLGKLPLIENLDLLDLYDKVKYLINNLDKMTISEIMELEKNNFAKNLDISVLVNMFQVVSLETNALEILDRITKLKRTLCDSVYPRLHLKNILYWLKT